MKELFIPYEQALALKELGFDEPCLKLWEHTEFWTILINPEEAKKVVSERYCNAPLYHQAFNWFLEKYNLFPETTLWGDGIGFISKIKQIRQEEFKEVYDLGIVPANKGIPNWDKAREDLYCIKGLIEIAQNGVKIQR